MRRLSAFFLGLMMASTALAAVPPAQISAKLTMRQRIEMRKSRRRMRVPITKPVTSSPRPVKWTSSSSSYSYTGTPVRGVLQIDQVSAGAATHAVGTEPVTLLTFDAVAGNEDVMLSMLKFHALQGSLASGSKYTLYAVSPGGVMTKITLANAGTSALAFSDFRFTLKKGVTQRFAVQAELQRNGVPFTLALGFLTSDPTFVQATGLTYGRDLAPGIQVDNGPCEPYVCRIFVRTRDSGSVTTQSAGSLFVTAHSVQPPAHRLVLGTTSDVLLRLTFHATGEDVAVTYLSIRGGIDSISGMELLLEGSSTPFATASTLQCDSFSASRFCAKAAAGLFVVPEDGDVRVLVRAIVKSEDDGGEADETVTLSLTDATLSSVAVKAQGTSSNEILEQNDGDGFAAGEIFIGRETPGLNAVITGPAHSTIESGFAGIENANPDTDLTPVPFGTSSQFAAFRFRTAPSGNGNTVQITTLVFTVAAHNVVIGSPVLFNTLNNSQSAACSPSDTTGTITITCSSLGSSGIGTTVDAGGTLTLALRANLTRGPDAGTSILQAGLNQLGDSNNTGTIAWTDGSASFDWIDVPYSQVKSTYYRS
ncbi:MAG: hypothetical protein HOO67_04585 [Candidatus Peribacteraceae bacterium]|nr:hypothetical protein [Candidatus Peribacteraceae bacterium]